MATLTATFKPNTKFPLVESDAEKAFKGLRTVFDYAKGGGQDTMICNTLVALAAKKDKTLNLPLKNAGFTLDGLPSDEDKRSGEHELKIKVGAKEVSKNKVWINRPATGINIGLASANTSEKASAALLKNKTKVEGLELKLGDGEHAKDLKWSLDGKSGSLPMTTHTKGDGGKNEKVALDFLKKTMKEAGYT